MEIKSKNDIIDYFASGIKQDELIGVENEQFLFCLLYTSDAADD